MIRNVLKPTGRTLAIRRLVAAPFLLAILPGPAASQEPIRVSIEEWTVPWSDSRPRDPFVASDGRVWFVGQTGDYVASLNPETGDFDRHDLPEGTGPHNLIVAESGTVFVAGNRTAEIQVLDPGAADVRRIPMPDAAARDPHTLVFAPDSSIWFTVQNGNRIGHFRPGEPTGDSIRLATVPTANSRPYGIVVDPSGRPWFTEFAAGKIGTVDPSTMELHEFELPRSDARPRRLQRTSDGAIWYVDFAGGMLGRLNVGDGSVREWPVPGGSEARPYGMAVDRSDRLWFVETGLSPNRFVGFDPSKEEFFSITPIPSGAGSVRHMFYDPSGEQIWFGTDAGTIGRARLEAPGADGT
ncbi:MAG: lyase [Gemmatimonadota bacterium]